MTEIIRVKRKEDVTGIFKAIGEANPQTVEELHNVVRNFENKNPAYCYNKNNNCDVDYCDCHQEVVEPTEPNH